MEEKLNQEFPFSTDSCKSGPEKKISQILIAEKNSIIKVIPKKSGKKSMIVPKEVLINFGGAIF